jgi:hypothetical protein
MVPENFFSVLATMMLHKKYVIGRQAYFKPFYKCDLILKAPPLLPKTFRVYPPAFVRFIITKAAIGMAIKAFFSIPPLLYPRQGRRGEESSIAIP